MDTAEQEPVAWGYRTEGDIVDCLRKKFFDHDRTAIDYDIPLYTAPTKREWVGLTQDEIEQIYTDNTRADGMCNGLSIALEVQNKLREKNEL